MFNQQLVLTLITKILCKKIVLLQKTPHLQYVQNYYQFVKVLYIHKLYVLYHH